MFPDTCERCELQQIRSSAEESQHPLLPRQPRWCLPLSAALLLVAVISIAAFINHSRSCAGCKDQTVPTEGGSAAVAAAAHHRLEAPPNAHLTAASNASQSGLYLGWEHQLGDAYLLHFTYDDRSLVVPESGRYSIYLQVTYRLPTDFPCRDGASVPFTQVVLRYTDSYPMDLILLTAQDSLQCKTDASAQSLYTAGVFSLSKGDRLLVQVTPQELIYWNEKMMFFGAFLVAPEG